MSGCLIPFYSYDGSYIDHIAIRRAERLEEMGRAKVVRHRKGHHVNRAVLLRGKDEAHATSVRDYAGQAYSFHQPLPGGHRPWKLRPLQGGQERCGPRAGDPAPDLHSRAVGLPGYKRGPRSRSPWLRTWLSRSHSTTGVFGLGRSDAAMMGGMMLAMDGLRRGGLLGVGETAAGGALISFKFGGPLGAAIGAGAGFAAGIVRLFVKGATEKARSKIRATYGVGISDKNVLKQIVDMAKQAFGGNLDMAIRSQQVRDLSELYAMSTGQKTTGMPATMQPGLRCSPVAHCTRQRARGVPGWAGCQHSIGLAAVWPPAAVLW